MPCPSQTFGFNVPNCVRTGQDRHFLVERLELSANKENGRFLREELGRDFSLVLNLVTGSVSVFIHPQFSAQGQVFAVEGGGRSVVQTTPPESRQRGGLSPCPSAPQAGTFAVESSENLNLEIMTSKKFRLLTEHDYLAKHLNKIGIYTNPNCCNKEEEMTEDHLITCEVLPDGSTTEKYWRARTLMASLPKPGIR
ncbi:hypothetical protein ANN_12228 [Periplaneta americana]|uniref:Uncharacterized protein n=1 Tax=Periplaneta americana TaxID=6978 RepID=A0ABQ8TI38_PERAM|nr:hypothetical protein ANN_12228 [Periplaneta americana]